MIQALRGMKDILPPESRKWEELNKKAGEVFSCFGYELSITPVVEKTELFVRSVGEDSDVVSKEMYTFKDRGDESITLRPEGTAPIMRAYLSSPEWKGKLLKTWYWGPMFRYERPQKGRYRQFNQFGLEAIGTDSPYIDAEIIYMLDFFYKSIGVDDVAVEINSIGCPDCRPSYKSELVNFFNSNKNVLCSDCNNRLSTNPLRVLDCKKESCIELVKKAPTIDAYLCPVCADHQKKVLGFLDSTGVVYRLNLYLVRGLDYYNRTVFEFVTEKLGGRQNALGGGGRYDSLSTQLGEKPVPAVGYAGGVERTVMFMNDDKEKKDILMYLAVMDKRTLDVYLPLIFELKKVLSMNSAKHKVIFIDDDFKVRDIKKHLSRADKLGASFAIIAGENELNKNTLILKDLMNKKEQEINLNVSDIKNSAEEIARRILA
jgi:histidyl-tRNA synthetase